ncbi:MAG: HEPN domain-containing protein [Rhodospirillales bacterium]|nr:HEPN domain-containing protein [Rhodospirillales bacterium]
MTEEQTQLIAKAEESLAAARVLVEQGFPGFSASRTYYAMFYLATVMLLEKNLRFKTHSALQGAFGREFTQSGILPLDLHGWLLDVANARNASDYLTDRLVSPEEAATHIKRAERFLAEVRAVLNKVPENEN